MWIPNSLLALFNINKETVDELRSSVAVLDAQNTLLERELTAVKINSDWLRFQVNQLNSERVQLMAKAYPGLVLPAPEITRIGNKVKTAFDLVSLFEDQGEDEIPKSSFSN
mgnify:CR=1